MSEPLRTESNFVVLSNVFDAESVDVTDTLYQELDEGDQTVRLSEPGSLVIVPRRVLHTARVCQPTQMFFITPGEGTENRERSNSVSG